MEKTGVRFCNNTPWTNIEDAMPCVFEGYWLDSDEFVAMAQKELEFLISLCPKPVGGE